MSDIDNVELSYQFTINKLEDELSELRKKRQLDALLGATAMQADEELITELRKDKKRLDWLMENDCLRDWIVDGVAYGLNEGREYIDEAMEGCIFDDLSGKQRQQICHEHGQPSE